MAFFTSRADLNVGIVNQYVLNNNGIIQGQGQQVIDFFNPTGGLPVSPLDGDRYISVATANGWVNNNVVVYDATLGNWKNMAPVPGTLVWLSSIAPPQMRVWNPTSGLWENPAAAMGSVVAVPSTDNALVRFNGVAGQVQNSGVTLDDLNNINGIQNANIAGNLTVGGTITATSTRNLVVNDQFINLNNGNTGGPLATGITMNYDSTGIATTSILPGFTPAIPATSDAQIQTAAAGPLWVAGDVVQVSGSISNDGLYEVQSHALNILTLKSTGINPPTLDFVQNQLVAEATVGADITGVNITILQSGTTGVLETATGNKSSDFVFVPVGGGITQNFTTIGTTISDVPTGVSNVRITMVGGGGGSGNSTTFGSGGGGSGCAIVGLIKPVTPGALLMSVTVAAGGIPGGYGGNSIVSYSGALPFTITAYGGGSSGEDTGNYTGGGGGGTAASEGYLGIPDDIGLGGYPSFTGLLTPAGGPGGDDITTDGVSAQIGSNGQTNGIVWVGSGGGGSGTPGATGGSNAFAGGNSLGNAGGGAGSYFGRGGDGAPNVPGTQGQNGPANSGAGAGGSYQAAGAIGGSGRVILEYF